jgi:Ca2+-transporting ATPase
MLSNLRLLGIVAVTFALQLMIHEVRALQPYFGTEPVSPLQALVWTGLASLPLLVLELRKVARRWRLAPAPAPPSRLPSEPRRDVHCMATRAQCDGSNTCTG